jgi:hypothetical protein
MPNRDLPKPPALKQNAFGSAATGVKFPVSFLHLKTYKGQPVPLLSTETAEWPRLRDFE